MKKYKLAVINSQSIKPNACDREQQDYDSGKNRKERKGFILTNTQGLLLAVYICGTRISEKADSMLMLKYTKQIPYSRCLYSRIKCV